MGREYDVRALTQTQTGQTPGQHLSKGELDSKADQLRQGVELCILLYDVSVRIV